MAEDFEKLSDAAQMWPHERGKERLTVAADTDPANIPQEAWHRASVAAFALLLDALQAHTDDQIKSAVAYRLNVLAGTGDKSPDFLAALSAYALGAGGIDRKA